MYAHSALALALTNSMTANSQMTGKFNRLQQYAQTAAFAPEAIQAAVKRKPSATRERGQAWGSYFLAWYFHTL